MNETNLKGPEEIRQLLAGTTSIEFTAAASTQERYRWIARTLKRFKYFHLRKRDKGTVLAYIRKITGYSRQQLTRLVHQYQKYHWIGGQRSQRHSFPKKYTREDTLLLAETDAAHNTLSGPATKKLFERAYTIYDDDNYQRLSSISVSHLYKLRNSVIYKQKQYTFEKTKRSAVAIAERRKPNPNGMPGYIRIDTVHQGDRDKEKGVYHINAVDEVTQFEIVCTVEKISESYLIPVIKLLLGSFPFEIKGFHSDNGSEYINYRVLKLLNKLLIEFTKSRARHSNDNALVESKNGSIIRKHLGYEHIPQKWASSINKFNQDFLNPYINYHRPCYFPVVTIDDKGRQKKKYPYSAMMTPFEKLKSLPNVEKYLKPAVSIHELEKNALAMSDLDAAKLMNQKKKVLFNEIFGDSS